MADSRKDLQPGEPHPMAHEALVYVRSIPVEQLSIHMEALSSCAIEGNRVGEICGETLRRVLHGEPVSDRYILGLAWYLRGALNG